MITKNYKVPENLKDILGNDFSFLMPYSYSEDETGEDNRNVLQDALNRISQIINNKLVYRAVASTRDDLDLDDLGKHWSGNINSVSALHNYGEFGTEKEIATIIMEAEITEIDPYELKQCINFPETIELQMWMGDIEDEIYFKNDDCLKLTKICEGNSLSEALEKFTDNKCELL